MKIKNLLIVAVLLMSTILGCKKDKDEEITPVDNTPKAEYDLVLKLSDSDSTIVSSTTTSHSADYGAVIKDGVITVNVKDGSFEFNVEFHSNSDAQLPGTFFESAWYTSHDFYTTMKYNGENYNLFENGSFKFYSCPGEGEFVEIDVLDVRLQPDGGNQRLINGTIKVKVVETDNSLSCKS